MIPPANMKGQCSTRNVLFLVISLAAHIACHTIARGRIGKLVCLLASAIAMVICVAFFNIDRLTVMHQIMGMTALEGAARFANDQIMFLARRNVEIALLIVGIIPNLLAGLDETFVHFSTDGSVHLHPMDRFATASFFRKQHAFLHYVLAFWWCIVLIAQRPSWRHSRKMQITRSFLDPACVVSIALILSTHTHRGGGSESHESHAQHLGTHPVIGALMTLAALTQLCANILHLSYSEDLSEKGSSAPVLKMSRLTNSFAHLLLANFLFVDTFMEYLGCRHVTLLNHGGETLLGLTLETEVSTYQACTLMLSAFMFGMFMHSQQDEKQEQPYSGIKIDAEMAEAEAEPEILDEKQEI